MSDDHPTLPYPEADREHPTLVIPGEERPAPRRRRRWPWVLLIILVVLAALVVAAEFLARAILPGVVRSIVIEQADLPADQQLEVDADGILLPQLIGGTLDSLHLSSDSVTWEGVTGAVDVTATGVPLRGGDLAGVSGTIRIDETEFTTLLAGSEIPGDEVVFTEPDVTVSGEVQVLGIGVPISLTVTPGASDGDLLLTPQGVTIGGIAVEAAQLQQMLGAFGVDLTEPQSVCIADQLPAGVTITGLSIQGSAAIIDVDVDGAIGSDTSLQDPGTCPRS